MSYGIQIYNDSGSMVINEEYSNYMAVAHGYAPNGSYDWGSYMTAADDMVFVRPHISNGYTLNWSAGSAPYLQSSSGYVEWVVARRNPGASSESFGLRVHRADGSVAFDSGYAPMCPVYNFRDTANEQAYNNGTVYSTTVNMPFPAAAGRKRFIPIDCFCPFITWNLIDTAAYYVSSGVTWYNDDIFLVFADQRFANSVAANVIYAKPVGALNYFFTEFAV